MNDYNSVFFGGSYTIANKPGIINLWTLNSSFKEKILSVIPL